MGLSFGQQLGLQAAGAAFNMAAGAAESKKQFKYQQQLNREQSERNYKYSEMSAENAYGRQLQMYEMSRADESYAARAQQLKDAGMNPALMFSSGVGGAGGSGQMGGGTQGSGAGGMGAGSAPQVNYDPIEGALAAAQIANIEADTEKKKAETTTENEKREYNIALLKQQAREQWYKNIEKKIKAGATPQELEGNGWIMYNHPSLGEFAIQKGSIFGQELLAEQKKMKWEADVTEGMAKLKTIEQEKLFVEIENAIAQNEADLALKKAQELSAKYAAGELHNAKYWVEIATKTVNGTIGAIGGAKGITQ